MKGLGVGLLVSGLVVAPAGCRRTSQAPQPLQIGLYTAPLALDPHLHNEFLTFSVLSNAFDALTCLDPYLRVQPALAESWISTDERTWRFRLRQGLTFHDGRPLQAADVAFSLERARRHPQSEFASYLSVIGEIRALDETSLQLVTREPQALLLNRLAFVLVVPRDSPDEIVNPVGSGAYRVASVATDGSLALEAFERHWAGAPAERQVRLRVIRGPGRGRRLLAGEVDVLIELAAEEVSVVESTPGFRVQTVAAPSVDVLRLRLDAPPFSDPRVRRALHLALDRQALVDRLVLGYGSPASQLVSREVFGHNPELAPAQRDLTAARKLLAEAGYPAGLEVSLEHRLGRRPGPIVAQLGEAGIRVRPAPRPWAELMQRLRDGQVQLSYTTLLADSGDAGDLLESTLHTRDLARGFGEANYGRYSNRGLDALIESAARAPQLEARRRILQECLRLALADLAIVPLFVRQQLYGFRSEVAWQARADGRLLAQDLRRISQESPWPTRR